MFSMKKTDSVTFKIILGFVLLMAVITVGSFIAVQVILGRIGSNVSQGTASAGETFSRHYAFIHAGGDTALWDNIYGGALERGRELDAYTEYFGSSLTASFDKNKLVSMAMDAGVDGIIIDGDSDEETSRLIREAAGRGTPTVTILSDCADSARICFVGFGSYTMGRQYGAEIIKHYSNSSIDVSVLMDPDSAGGGQDLIISGISDEFADKGLRDACNVKGVYVHDDTPFTAEEEIRDIFMGRNLPGAIVALNSVYTRCLYQAAVDYNKVGDVYMYGFNDSDDILEAVDKGLLEATISVDATHMGASAVEALDEYLNTGYVSNYITQDTEVIRAGDVIREETE